MPLLKTVQPLLDMTLSSLSEVVRSEALRVAANVVNVFAGKNKSTFRKRFVKKPMTEKSYKKPTKFPDLTNSRC